MTPVQLPEVPAPIGHLHSDDDFCRTVPVYPDLWPVDVYTAAQLREYATAAVMAERARLAGLLSRTIRDAVFKNFDQSASRYKVITGPSTIALSVQVEVLALLTPSETNSER